jgi:DNA repair ATPase RecN
LAEGMMVKPDEIVRATQKMAQVDRAMRNHHVSKDTATEYKKKIKQYLKANGVNL